MRKKEFKTDLYNFDVYEDGRIFNNTNNCFVVPYINNTGHQFISVKISGKQYHLYIHRLVYELFNDKIPKDYAIHHVDSNKKNNNLSNLMCLPSKEHKKLHQQKYFDKIMKCPICGKEFIWSCNKQSTFYKAKSTNKISLLGIPFCSHSCRCKFGRSVQLNKIELLNIYMKNAENIKKLYK